MVLSRVVVCLDLNFLNIFLVIVWRIGGGFTVWFCCFCYNEVRFFLKEIC